MDIKTYEAHNLEGKNLPIIFHYDTRDKNDTVKFNWHRNIEILYITNGEGEVFGGPVNQQISKGDIYVVNSNLLHNIQTDSHIEYYCLIIDIDFLISNGIDSERLEYQNLIRSEYASKLFCSLIEEIESDNSFKITAIKTNVLSLMLYLSRNHLVSNEGSNKLWMSSDENIKLAIGYIRSHLTQPLSLDEVSKEAGLSKYYFLREFKKATGMTPINYINMQRIQNAKKLLTKNKYSIHEIAIQCGFENDSYFSKTFKKYTGFLPSEYASKAI